MSDTSMNVVQINSDEIDRMVNLCDLFAQATLHAEDQARPVTPDDILALAFHFKAQSTPMFMIAPETYQTIQRIISQRPHQRKLRKCHMRKIVARQRRERGLHR